jgi:hypothetical protein
MWLHDPISRLDFGSLPELGALEMALPLDRDSRLERDRVAMYGAVGVGYGRTGDRSGTASQLVAALGWKDRKFIVGARSELTAFDDAVARGHHTLLVHVDNFRDDMDGPRAGLDITGAIDHGEARGLAPVQLGTGVRESAEVKAEGHIAVSKGRDANWVLGLRGELGGTQWHDATVATASRRAVGVSYGATPGDGELPRGTFDVLRGRIEDTTIATSQAVALGGSVGPLSHATIRTSTVSVGLHDFTLHIDRELMGVVDMNLGWAWMESDTDRALGTDMFRMKLATHLKWWTEGCHDGPRRLGIAIAREPGFTADGRRLVGDWRAQVATGFENTRGRFDVRGGISWLTPVTGGATTDDTIVRYGAQLDAALRLGGNLELAAYHASWFEPRAMDPWAAGRQWSLEAGVLLRLAKP